MSVTEESVTIDLRDLSNKVEAAVDTNDLAVVTGLARELYAGILNGEVRGKYAIGLLVQAIFDKSRFRVSDYGVDLAGSIAEALGVSKSWMYSCGRLTNTWYPEEMEAILLRSGKSSKRISASHLDALTNRNLSRKQRKRLLDMVFVRGLTVEELSEIISSKVGPKLGRRGEATRKPADPIDHIRKLTDKSLARLADSFELSASLVDAEELSIGERATIDESLSDLDKFLNRLSRVRLELSTKLQEKGKEALGLDK